LSTDGKRSSALVVVNANVLALSMVASWTFAAGARLGGMIFILSGKPLTDSKQKMASVIAGMKVD